MLLVLVACRSGADDPRPAARPDRPADSWSSYLQGTVGRTCTIAAPQGPGTLSQTLISRGVREGRELFEYELSNDGYTSNLGFSVGRDGRSDQSGAGVYGELAIFTVGPDLPPPSELGPGRPPTTSSMLVGIQVSPTVYKRFRYDLRVTPVEPFPVLVGAVPLHDSIAYTIKTLSVHTEDRSAGAPALQRFSEKDFNLYRDLEEFTYALGLGVVHDRSREGVNEGRYLAFTGCTT